MDDDLLKRSLQNLEEELRKLDSQLAQLGQIKARRDLIYGLVTQMRFMFEMGPYKPPEIAAPKPEVYDPNAPTFSELMREQEMSAMLASDTISLVIGKKPIWVSAREILRQANQPLELAEILEALKGFGYPTEGRPGKESVRAILHKKPEMFERTEDGKYKLKA